MSGRERDNGLNKQIYYGDSCPPVIRRGIELAADLLWPPRCPLCDKVRPFGQDVLCPGCGKKLPFVKQPWCMCCGRQMEEDDEEYCFACRRQARSFDRGKIIFLYEGDLRESVLRMKFHNRRDYIPFYAREMAREAETFLAQCAPQAFVPVPMHPKKRRARGFDQSLLLCRAMTRETGIETRSGLVVRTRNTLPSKALGADERRRNLRGAFAPGSGAVPERVMIIDDIFTTGATMGEVARVLKLGGAKHVTFLALCGVRA